MRASHPDQTSSRASDPSGRRTARGRVWWLAGTALVLIAVLSGRESETLSFFSNRLPDHSVSADTVFVPGDARVAIEELAALLEADFIYPELGRRYAEMLRTNLERGTYSGFSTATAFAEQVTTDLMEVHPEGHLRVWPPSAELPDGHGQLNGVGKAGWLEPGVAYLSLHGFAGTRERYGELMERLRHALGCLASAEILIMDARDHRGGGFEEMDIMFSHFFDEPTLMIEMDVREEVEERGASPLVEGETLRRVDGPEGIVRRAHFAVPSDEDTALKEAEIFLLTSERTASAGEHLSVALKRTGRATLIGETTAGAGHFGRTVDLGGGYRSFVPVGRPFDPDTGEGWEHTGVAPHVGVPADEALSEALSRVTGDPGAAEEAQESLEGGQAPC